MIAEAKIPDALNKLRQEELEAVKLYRQVNRFAKNEQVVSLLLEARSIHEARVSCLTSIMSANQLSPKNLNPSAKFSRINHLIIFSTLRVLMTTNLIDDRKLLQGLQQSELKLLNRYKNWHCSSADLDEIFSDFLSTQQELLAKLAQWCTS